MAKAKQRADIEPYTAAQAKKKFPALAKVGFSHLINTLVCRQLDIPDPLKPNDIKRVKALSREAKKRRQKLETKGQRALIEIDTAKDSLSAAYAAVQERNTQ